MAAPYNPPKKNEDFLIRIALQDMALAGSFKANPTIAAGDFKVDIDGAGVNNLATLPSCSPAASVLVLITLAAAEMNGDVITIVGIDQTSPKEWADFVWSIATTGADPEITAIQTELAKVPKSDSNVSWNATALAAIQSECNDALVAAALATAAELAKVPKSDSNVSWNATALAAIQSECNDAIVAATLPTAAQVKTAIEAAGGHLALILEDTGTTIPALLPAALVGGKMDCHVNDIANDAITAAAIANGAIDAATFAADVDAEILSYLVDDATRIDASALNTLSGHDPGEAIMGATDITVAGIADGVWDEAIAGHAGAGSTGLALSAGSAPTAVQNADALLGRSIVGGADGGRTVKDALKLLRNKRAVAAGTLTVYEADDTTPAWTATIATTAGDPVSSVDPA